MLWFITDIELVSHETSKIRTQYVEHLFKNESESKSKPLERDQSTQENNIDEDQNKSSRNKLFDRLDNENASNFGALHVLVVSKMT